MRFAVLVSGRGANMAALIAAAAEPDFPAQPALVVSDVPDAPALARARDAGVAALAFDRVAYASRHTFEDAIDGALQVAKVDLVCLAGFMRVLSPRFVAAWRGRILNIHPSLLPSFPGLETHARALTAGVRVHGATVHVVTEALDDGPIVAQAAVPVLDGDDAAALAARVLEAELRLYPFALRLYAEHVAGSAPRHPVADAALGASVLFSPPLRLA